MHDDLGDHQVDPTTETTLYRVYQEAMINVDRHARAQSVHVYLSVTADDHVELRLCDDGQGFDPEMASHFVRQGHFGLAGMRERVQGSGGEWQLVSAPGEGTTITARLPVQAAAEASLPISA